MGLRKANFLNLGTWIILCLFYEVNKSEINIAEDG